MSLPIFFIRRFLLVALLPLIAALTACGGGDSSDKAHMRLVNVSPAYASLDLYSGGEETLTDVKSGAVSGQADVETGTYTTTLTSSGSTTTLVSLSLTLTKSYDYAVIAYGESGSLKAVAVTEEEDEPSSQYAKLRVLNTATSAGSLDVYITAAGATSLTDSATLTTALGVGSPSSYADEGAGTYDLWVTGYGDKNDVRLHLSSLSLASKEIATVILTPSAGGVLVDAYKLVQGGGLTAYANSSARVRLVAGVADGKTVAATLGTTVLSAGTTSPNVGAYVLVPAGSYTPSVSVAGLAVPASVTLAAGSDYSLVVHGTAAAPLTWWLTDDNTYSTDSAKAKFRLVHAAADLQAQVLTLSADYSTLVTNVGYASASSYAAITSGTLSDLTVTSNAGTTVYQKAPTNGIPVSARGIYTVWMLGNATGVLLRDR